jgi:UDP-N-acetylmuramoyl-L-alanyl-D-glutamate--2,6-diaminopimelate ligase
VIVTEDNSRDEPTRNILADIVSGLPKDTAYKVIPDRAEAILFALGKSGKNDIVAIVGKGHEQYKIDENGMHPFSERAIVADYFSGAKR